MLSAQDRKSLQPGHARDVDAALRLDRLHHDSRGQVEPGAAVVQKGLEVIEGVGVIAQVAVVAAYADYLAAQQDKNSGNWNGGYVGPVFATTTGGARSAPRVRIRFVS